MRVNTLFPLAVHSLVIISVFTNEVEPPTDVKETFKPRTVTSTLISGSTGSNAVIIRNILSELKNSGFISVSKGRGGTKLAKSSKEITLWDIYSCVEQTDSAEVFKMHSNCSQYCKIGKNISRILPPHFDSAFSAMKAELSKVTLYDVVSELYVKIGEE